MKTKNFDFFLPEHLIAQQPPLERGQSRLMLLDRRNGKRTHTCVSKLPDILCGEKYLSPFGEKPLLVFNDTKVRKARLTGRHLKPGTSGGTLAEFLLIEPAENEIGSEEPGMSYAQWKVITKHTGRKKEGDIFTFFNEKNEAVNRAVVTGREDIYLFLKFDIAVGDDFLDRYGHVPLPPYIKRPDVSSDTERYQTIYAKQTGSAAAPTAGLHFNREILDRLKENGIESAFVTLHTGIGTFLPVRSENIEDHVMHEEQFIITEENASVIESAVRKKRKIIAVGTTSLRSLESALLYENIRECEMADNADHCTKILKRGRHRTSIFIYPGYEFKIVDALFTNFHTPFSTLLMLVSAFAGKDLIPEAYAEAVREGYRFFSYGDAMLIS